MHCFSESLKVIPQYCIARPYCTRFSRHERGHLHNLRDLPHARIDRPALRPGFLFGPHGRRGYSPDISINSEAKELWREASEVFRLGEKEGWFRLRARQFAGNDSIIGSSFIGSRQQHFHCQGQTIYQQSQSTRRESSLPPRTELWQTSLCIRGTNHWRWRAAVVQRAPWQPFSEVSTSDNLVCFDVAFRLRGCQEWCRVHHKGRKKSYKNVSGLPSQKQRSGSADNICKWWAKMSSQASTDVPVTQTRGNEIHFPRGDWALKSHWSVV